MNVSPIAGLIAALTCLSLSACNAHSEAKHQEAQKITVAAVQSQAVTLTQRYVADIHSHHHIKIRTPQAGYVKAIEIEEGQAVQKGDLLFQIQLAQDRGTPNANNAEKVISVHAPFDGIV